MTDQYGKLKKEYEEFAYIVSHDLNAPLRHLKQFSQLLIDERQEFASNEERIYLDFMAQALSNLDEMMTALLTFSRINTKAEPLQKINCNEIISDIVVRLKHQYASFHPEIRVDVLPELEADRTQLAQLFYQLIDNALKFSSRDNGRECWVACEERDTDFLFSIKDNGIGIPEKFHEEVFRIFRHLHEKETFPGTGAGLSYARKIVERHKGIIWLESEPDKGTTVFFTFPKSTDPEGT